MLRRRGIRRSRARGRVATFALIVAGAVAPAARLPAASAPPAEAPSGASAVSVRSPPPDATTLVARARAIGLAAEPAWRRLLHYHPRLAAPGTPRSHVDDARFFLAANGRDDPAAELDATIAALFGDAVAADAAADAVAPPPSAADIERVAEDAPRCRFVARERWLRERLGLAATEVPARCRAYHAWRATLRAHSLTLVFPDAYLNNPSSMFGHTLLRLDPPEIERGSDWLSWALSFAADTGEDSPHGVAYAWKGITGGYPGRFELVPYFRKIREYGAIENRDIWEYRLDLSPAEVERLVEHLWELRDIRFDYFFFRENCSFRLLELLDHARPTLDLAADFPLAAIPADTVRAVAAAGLIDGRVWLPSSASLLRHESARVPRVARGWIERLARDPERAVEPDFETLGAGLRRDVLVAANRLLIHRARRAPPSAAAAERRLSMLTRLSAYPTPDLAGPSAPRPPERGHDTTLATLGIGREDDLDYTELGLRLSYHDLLDRAAGYAPGAAITLGELRLRADADGTARLEALELVRIRSLGAPVPFLFAPSWGLDVGIVRDRAIAAGRAGLRIGGLAGVSRAPFEGERLLLYALGGASLHLLDRAGEGQGREVLNAHLALGALSHRRFGGTRLELRIDSLEGRAPRLGAELAHDLPLSRNHALRARVAVSDLDDERLERVSLAYRLHF